MQSPSQSYQHGSSVNQLHYERRAREAVIEGLRAAARDERSVLQRARDARQYGEMEAFARDAIATGWMPYDGDPVLRINEADLAQTMASGRETRARSPSDFFALLLSSAFRSALHALWLNLFTRMKSTRTAGEDAYDASATDVLDAVLYTFLERRVGAKQYDEVASMYKRGEKSQKGILPQRRQTFVHGVLTHDKIGTIGVSALRTALTTFGRAVSVSLRSVVNIGHTAAFDELVLLSLMHVGPSTIPTNQFNGVCMFTFWAV